MDRPQAQKNATALPSRARTLLKQAGIRARKRLGQHFLIDRKVLKAIIRAADLSPEDTVIEVGPGLGILTTELAKRAGSVIAVELDTKLSQLLASRLQGMPSVKIVNADILKVSSAELLEGKTQYKVVANLPYYITSPVLHHFALSTPRPSLMVVMLQREVAEAVVAREGKMGLLAIALHIYSKPRIVAYVSPQSFYPPPKVESAIVRFDMLPQPAIDVDVGSFLSLVRCGFSSPRKKLRNSLAQGLGIKPAEATSLLERAGIAPERRPETLALEEWAKLYEAVTVAGIALPPC